MTPSAIALLKGIFWIGSAVVAYAYVGYGILLYGLIRLKRLFFSKKNKKTAASDSVPEAALIICAWNEAAFIREKIANTLALDYPPERLHIVFVTDGSSDDTPQIIRDYPLPPNRRLTLLHQDGRAGKLAAFKRAMSLAKEPIVVSTDANTYLNPEALRRLLAHFSDPRVGAVAGEKRIAMGLKEAANSAGEGLYWRYESALKRWDAELWSVVGAAGELFAFRRECYEAPPPDTIVEDFYLTMQIARKGWRVQYEPDAYAVESASASVAEEFKRKTRIAAGGLQAVARLAPLLNPLRYGVLSFQYISHRVLRWTLAPLLLPLIFASNLILAIHVGELYAWLFAGQALFYALAAVGFFLEKKQMRLKAFFVPYYFCMMNYAQYAGALRLLRGRQSVLWEKARRSGE
ncbi:MAG: glycosyltransferase family 2 protein [Saprospiraceae bacterium]